MARLAWLTKAVGSNYTGSVFGRYYINGEQVDRATYMSQHGDKPKPKAPTPKQAAKQADPADVIDTLAAHPAVKKMGLTRDDLVRMPLAHLDDMARQVGVGTKPPKTTDTPRYPSAHNPEITYGHKDDRDSDDKHFSRGIKQSAKEVRQVKAKLQAAVKRQADAAKKVEQLQASDSASAEKIAKLKQESEQAKANVAALKAKLKPRGKKPAASAAPMPPPLPAGKQGPPPLPGKTPPPLPQTAAQRLAPRNGPPPVPGKDPDGFVRPGPVAYPPKLPAQPPAKPGAVPPPIPPASSRPQSTQAVPVGGAKPPPVPLHSQRPGTPPPLPGKKPLPTALPIARQLPPDLPNALPHARTQQDAITATNAFHQAINSGQDHRQAYKAAVAAIDRHFDEGSKHIDRLAQQTHSDPVKAYRVAERTKLAFRKKLDQHVVGMENARLGQRKGLRMAWLCKGYGLDLAVPVIKGWVTIGAKADGDGEKTGGTPVFIEGGKIARGPKHMIGRAPDDLKGSKPKKEGKKSEDNPSTGVDTSTPVDNNTSVSRESPATKPEDKKMEPVALKGSEKQIKWATDIRAKLVDEAEKRIAVAKNREEIPESLAQKISDMEAGVEWMKTSATASAAWINQAQQQYGHMIAEEIGSALRGVEPASWKISGNSGASPIKTFFRLAGEQK